jgi:hypothetical protein
MDIFIDRFSAPDAILNLRGWAQSERFDQGRGHCSPQLFTPRSRSLLTSFRSAPGPCEFQRESRQCQTHTVSCPEVVIALLGVRAAAPFRCRRHLAFAFATRRRTSTPAPLSANSRLRQLVVRLTDRFPTRPAQAPYRHRKTLPLTRSPLHSRPTGDRR